MRVKYQRRRKNQKRSMRITERSVRFAKLDWKDPRNEQLFQKADNEESTAKQRNLNDLYGVNSVKCNPTKENELDRKALEYQIQKEHPMENEAQIMKRVQNVSSLEGSGYTSQPITTNDCQSKNYEIKNYTNIVQINVKDIEKLMRNKGITWIAIRKEESYSQLEKIAMRLHLIRN